MSDQDEEMLIISTMLDAAFEGGVEDEVVYSFACALRSGAKVETAAAMAMNDWDLV